MYTKNTMDMRDVGIILTMLSQWITTITHTIPYVLNVSYVVRIPNVPTILSVVIVCLYIIIL